MIKRIFCSLLLAALTLPAFAAFDVAQLMNELASHKGGKAKFVEKKYISLLDKPLVSTGEMSYTAPDRLEKRTLTPKVETLLLGARMRGQEKGHIGREAGVPDNGRAGQHGEQPEQESTAGRHLHLSSIGSIFITERSPSACRYSMLRIWFLLPLTTMRSTSAAIFCSLGSNVSTHLSCVPAKCSR